MSYRLTLEGDKTLPEDFQIIRAYGKFIPTGELQGDELLGDFYLEGFNYYSPSLAQLSGPESAFDTLHLGSFVHDDAYAIALSGDELGWLHFAKLFRGFKLPAFKPIRMPNVRIKAPNLSKSFKGVSKGISNATKSVGKAGKDFVKAHQKALKDAGKFAGKIAEGGIEALQAIGQQGAGGEAPEEDPSAEEGNPEEQISEGGEPSYEDQSSGEDQGQYEDESEEVNGELGFFPQMAAVQSGVQGITSIVGAIDARNERKAKLKSDAKTAQINSLAQLFRPQAKQAAPVRRAVPTNKTFSQPAISKTSEGKLAVSFANRNLQEGNNPPSSDSPKDDKDKMLLYGGAALVVLFIIMFVFKGK
ncbi:hypothetical protein LEP1GSC188_3123 [Leptospira weilii serovar Topaz str. LT2116]|uniref:Uncharacterized protein n=1 Tax=Leptospira weilii serovar Topaz str. LT2116 TaxID=1088540 RepID=M3GWL5_9LEPT|nr:hypothetical protein LEP1GSC188_3123 [Leptospira weilii serovar Topaz str. LT2116]